MSGFHGAFATGVASLTLPDTWFRPPLWDLLVLQLLRPDSSNLPCLYWTIHLEYPLVLLLSIDLSSTSHIDISMTYCPLINQTLIIISVRYIPPELEIKYTAESNTSTSYLDLPLSIGGDGQLHTSLYDKRDNFYSHTTTFRFLSSNIHNLRPNMAFFYFATHSIRQCLLLL